jgi:Fic family protein
MKLSYQDMEIIIQKTKFWDRCRNNQLNERQIKVLQKILDLGADNFLGGLSTKKYIAITKTSKATAVRDIKELIEYGCIAQVKGTSGRNVRYEILINQNIKANKSQIPRNFHEHK